MNVPSSPSTSPEPLVIPSASPPPSVMTVIPITSLAPASSNVVSMPPGARIQIDPPPPRWWLQALAASVDLGAVAGIIYLRVHGELNNTELGAILIAILSARTTPVALGQTAVSGVLTMVLRQFGAAPPPIVPPLPPSPPPPPPPLAPTPPSSTAPAKR